MIWRGLGLELELVLSNIVLTKGLALQNRFSNTLGERGSVSVILRAVCLHLFPSLLTCYFSRQEVGPVHPYLQPPLILTVLDDLLEWNGWSGILEAGYKVLAGPILVFWEKPGHVRIPPPSFRCSHMLTDTLDMWLSNSSHHLMAIMYKIPSTTCLTEPSQPTWL